MGSQTDRMLGLLFGLAVGDAVGTTVEFSPRGSFEPLTDMVGGGPFDLKVGEWTDDTSMALCLAQSLIYHNHFDPADQMNRYVNWREHGYMSSNGRCFDIGVTTSAALSLFLQSGAPYSGSTDPQKAGNGSIMRLAPIPMFYYPDIESAIWYAGESSRTTHGANECIDACRYMAAVLAALIDGASMTDALKTEYYVPTEPGVAGIREGHFLSKGEPEIKSSGYVIHTLEAALWAFMTTTSYREAVLKVANLGDDADTTAAVCGQFAGAYYGRSGIPAEWLEKVAKRELLEALSLKLINANGGGTA